MITKSASPVLRRYLQTGADLFFWLAALGLGIAAMAFGPVLLFLTRPVADQNTRTRRSMPI